MTKRGRIDKLPPSRFVSRKICVNTLFRIILTMTVALCTPLLKAAEVDVDEVAYQALKPVVAALMNADDAEELIARGEKLEQRDSLQAIAVYLAAVREDPKQMLAPYKVASLFAYRGDYKLSERYLKVADERGMWFGPLMADDRNLINLRQTSTFKRVLANAQNRYEQIAGDKVGAISVLNPSGILASSVCRPVVVRLHGYGGNGELGEDYQSLADTGAILLGINGTEMIDTVDSFRWIGPGFEGTHQAVQSGLKKLATQHCIDRKHVYLMGFSQGSLHAGALLAQHPDDYAGALLISPGGLQSTPTTSLAQGKRVVVIHGKMEAASNREMSAEFRKLFSEAGHNEVRSVEHEGGHRYPDDWRTSLPQALHWLMGSEA